MKQFPLKHVGIFWKALILVILTSTVEVTVSCVDPAASPSTPNRPQVKKQNDQKEEQKGKNQSVKLTTNKKTTDRPKPLADNSNSKKNICRQNSDSGSSDEKGPNLRNKDGDDGGKENQIASNVSPTPPLLPTPCSVTDFFSQFKKQKFKSKEVITFQLSGNLDSENLSRLHRLLKVSTLKKIILDLRGCSCSGMRVIDQKVFENLPNLVGIIFPLEIQEVGERAFYNCKYLKFVEFPATINKVGDCAFYNCCNLERVKFLSGVQKIGESVFWNCGKLKSIVFSPDLEEVGDGAFHGCKNLKRITIPGSVKEMGKDIFEGCAALKSIHIENRLRRPSSWNEDWKGSCRARVCWD